MTDAGGEAGTPGAAPALPPKHRLEYLDGLRGWASLGVVFSHSLETWLINPTAMKARGLDWILDLINATPLGVMMDGTLAVMIFFTISGTALSFPILTSKSPSRTLVEMGLLRFPRLTIPIVASCLIAYVLLANGLLVNQPAAWLSNSTWLVWNYAFPADFSAMVRFTLWDVYFDYSAFRSWNAVLWTMPVEAQGSFAVFISLFLIRWPLARTIIAVAMAGYLARSPLCGFFAGVVIAEIIHRRRTTVQPAQAKPIAWAGALLLLFALAAAIFIRTAAGHRFMRATGIQAMLILNVISISTVLGVALFPQAARALSNRASRFMGRISFSLYLVHLIIICSFSSALYLLLEPHVGFATIVFVIPLATVAISIPVAVLFSRVVEDWALGTVKASIRSATRSLWFARQSVPTSRQIDRARRAEAAAPASSSAGAGAGDDCGSASD